MDKEYEILEHIANDKSITQRKLANRAGLSLGSANILIKRLIKKGLIKVEHINNRTLKYVITPIGMLEKAKKTYEYIVYSYKYITEINNKIREIVVNKELRDVLICGQRDEVHEIVSNALKEAGIRCIQFNTDGIKDTNINKKTLIFAWDIQTVNLLNENGFLCINILEV